MARKINVPLFSDKTTVMQFISENRLEIPYDKVRNKIMNEQRTTQEKARKRLKLQ